MRDAQLNRRAFNETLAALATLLATGAPAAAGEAAQPAPAHDAPDHDMGAMGGMPANWRGKERIALLIYPQFTALDMVGPHYMLSSLMGATVHVVARTKEPVTSDAGLVFMPSASFDDCPADLDILFAPGGTNGTLAAMQDEATIAFLKDRGARAKYVTSVCTGSLLLGAAGLLQGYRATSHWLTRPALAHFGAIPTEARVVRDRNRVTGAGVTSGLDFGLSLLGTLRDATYAQGVQLLAEYDPQPPYHAGSPGRAPKVVKEMMDGMFAGFLRKVEETSRAASVAKAPR